MAAETPEPTELIYAPADTAAPIAIAAGLLLILTGFIIWIAFSLVGLGLLFYGIRSWIRTADSEISVMRREQRTDTAVIPAKPARR